MSIKFKISIIAASISLIMILSIVSMRWTVATLNSLSQTHALNQALAANMLMLRRNEKDFLLRHDLQYLDAYNKNYQLILENAANLSDMLDKHNISIDAVYVISSSLENYQLKFHALVDISQIIGLNQNTGLRGTLRGSVHQAEDIVTAENNDTLLKDMLMLRRNEKDFLMRKKMLYVDKFKHDYLLFIQDVEMSSLGDTYKQQLLMDLNRYKKDFLKLTELEELKGLTHESGFRGEMRRSVHQSELLIKNISDEIESKIYNTSDEIQNRHLIGATILALLFLSIVFLFMKTVSQKLTNAGE